MAGTSDMANPFVDWLRELLEAKGLKRQWLIENASLDSGHLSRVMNRQADATPEIIIKIARALEMDEAMLLEKAQVIRPSGSTPEGKAEDAIYKRYQRATSKLTDREKDLAIDMFEFLAGRLVEERGKKPARTARGEESQPDPPTRRRTGHAGA